VADKVFRERSEIYSDECNQKLPPMREKMMPDILPSLFGFEVEVHRLVES
jgi:hypothetical protein